MERVFNNKVVLFETNFFKIIMLFYLMAYVISNWYDPRLITLFGLISGGGIIIFPFTFLLTDLITEVYGYKNARFVIWSGFIFNLGFVLYGFLVSHIPAPQGKLNILAFDHITTLSSRIIIASGIGYLCSEPINSFLMAKLKIYMNGDYIGIRFIASTVIGSLIDTMLFCFLGFYGLINDDQMLGFIFSSWVIKAIVEIIGLPIFIRLAKKLKKIEQIDIYDRNTNFNLFKLDVGYAEQDNEYKG